MRISRRTLTLSAVTSPFVIPAVAHSQATPPASHAFEHATDRLLALLEYVPRRVPDEDLNVMWTDIERHLPSVLDHAGAAAEELPEDQLASMSLYAAGSDFFSWAYELESITGYTFATIRETVAFGNTPAAGLLVKLDISADSLIPFWESQDYQQLENEFGTFWSMDETAAISFENPIQRRMMARLNNVAILEDDLVVYATTSEFLRRVMSTASGDSPNRVSALDGVAAGFPEDATSAWFLDGGMLEYGAVIGPLLFADELASVAEEMMAESDDAVGIMPIIGTVCVGAAAGGHLNDELHNPDAREFMVLETSRFNMAEQAAKVIDWRIENFYSLDSAAPYAELLSNLQIDVIDGETVRLSRPMSVPRPMLLRLVANRDVLPFTFKWGQ